jgi:hypothetical protein
MAGDLGPLRQVPQIRERKFQSLGDQPIDAQPPIGKIAFLQGRIFVALGHPCAIHLEHRGQITGGEFAGARVAAEQPLGAIGQPLGRGKKRLEIRGLGEPVTTGEQEACRGKRKKPAPGEQNVRH